MSDERVWLKHPPTGGFFHAPVAAVDDWADRGWVPTDERPEEVNLATAHMKPPAEDVPVQETKPRKRAAAAAETED